MPFDSYPLYAYNTLIGLEFPLPIFGQLNYATLLPRNRLVVNEGMPGSATFKSMWPTEYFLYLSTYRIVDAKF